MPRVLAIVLGGGKGTRLYPLTKERAKPAVPFGGKYRLVDIPISNCINAGFRQIYILTQFNSASLHNHIANTYIFDVFSKGFVEILAAEQTPKNDSWYQGTADAVRKNFGHFKSQNPTHYIILSGDQLYSMDLADMFNKHIKSGAKISIAAHPVTRSEASQLGILATDKKLTITNFMEKPGDTLNIDEFKISNMDQLSNEDKLANKEYLGSMGMYIFDAKTLESALDNHYTDFGKEIIPRLIKELKVNAYVFNNYWEDIGTIRSFYEANLNLTKVNPDFNFYNENAPIYTHRRQLPATKMNFCTVSQSLTAEGSIITNASIVNSVIGVRTLIESGANLDGVVILGAKSYETIEEKEENKQKGIPNLGIGQGTIIKNAIIDKNARIGNNCRIGVDNINRVDGDYGFYHIIDGIIVIPKDAIIMPGTCI